MDDKKDILIYPHKLRIILAAIVVGLIFFMRQDYYSPLFFIAIILFLTIIIEINQPKVIINKEGIIIRWYGFINWSDIKNLQVRYFGFYYSGLETKSPGRSALIISLKNPNESMNKFSIFGKISLRIMKIFTSEMTVRLDSFLLSQSAEEIFNTIINNDYFILPTKEVQR